MQLELLSTLKEKMTRAEDLEGVMMYFYDNFVGQGELPRRSVPVEGSFLEDMLPQTVKGMLHKEVRIKGLRLMAVPQYDFIHGTFWGGDFVGTLIYFEDVEVGVISLSHPVTEDTYVVRFRTCDAPNDWLPSVN
ncbi:MAG: hypothetical protein HY318_20315 [Armatimonadetes bacterium]|nr:hypothetical protein [Armatimonadota bacterium]